MKTVKIVDGEPLTGHECIDCKLQHTPGPWKLVEGMGSTLVNVSGHMVTFDQRKTEGQANARLIATAPELLDALEVALDTLENGPQSIATSNTIPFIKEAIAKAEGK